MHKNGTFYKSYVCKRQIFLNVTEIDLVWCAVIGGHKVKNITNIKNKYKCLKIVKWILWYALKNIPSYVDKKWNFYACGEFCLYKSEHDHNITKHLWKTQQNRTPENPQIWSVPRPSKALQKPSNRFDETCIKTIQD